MLNEIAEQTRRTLLAATGAMGALALLPSESIADGTDDAVRPFRINIPKKALSDLRRRVMATRFPEKETVADTTQGVQLAVMRELMHYWGTSYDWRKVEARLNALPMFTTKIDGLDIHFIHVKSRHENALPLIITHGWPGSVIELLGIVDPLTNPTARGGSAEDAFDLVLPSIPGFGFSGKPGSAGWGTDRIAKTWAQLMTRLGYTHYVAQGGDWGAPITSTLARQAPAGLRGIHLNLPAAVPLDVAKALGGGIAPAGLSDKERAAFDILVTFNAKLRGYFVEMQTRPQTIGYALTDSPVGLAAWIFDYHDCEPQRLLNKDQILDDITLYWLTDTAASSARLYWESGGPSIVVAAAQKTADISLPVAVTVFPDEIYRAPETWARRAYPNLAYFHEVDRGGHFAAWEEPELFASEMRAAFHSLRT